MNEIKKLALKNSIFLSINNDLNDGDITALDELLNKLIEIEENYDILFSYLGDELQTIVSSCD
jgi:hypothetical protein